MKLKTGRKDKAEPLNFGTRNRRDKEGKIAAYVIVKGNNDF